MIYFGAYVLVAFLLFVAYCLFSRSLPSYEKDNNKDVTTAFFYCLAWGPMIPLALFVSLGVGGQKIIYAFYKLLSGAK